MAITILGLSGSLRAGSFNSALLDAAAAVLGGTATMTRRSLGTLPLFDSGLENSKEPAALIDAIAASDALLVASPEYNYSISGVLKNAIDWASRPAYTSCLAHKPVGILGASMSAVGSARAQAHLRQIFGGTLSPIFPHPEFVVGGAHKKFSAQGDLIDEATREHLRNYMTAFASWVADTLRSRS